MLGLDSMPLNEYGKKRQKQRDRLAGYLIPLSVKCSISKILEALDRLVGRLLDNTSIEEQSRRDTHFLIEGIFQVGLLSETL